MSDEWNKPLVTLHMVSSLDGFIARKDNSVAWLEECGGEYEAGVAITDDDMAAFMKSIDCYVMAHGHTSTLWSWAGLMARLRAWYLPDANCRRRKRMLSFMQAISKSS